jgi:uncharacterized protein
MIISEINIYPIKSLKGIALSESIVEKGGLRFDRRWMLTDSDGMFFTQRQVPKMATVKVRVESGELRVESENGGEMRVPFEPDKGHRQNVVVWRSQIAGLVYNGEVSEWFSDVLSRKCQLVLMPEGSERHVNEEFDTGDDIVSFADGYPLLLTCEASLAELNDRIEESWEKSEDAGRRPSVRRLPMNRFRPNIVVKGSEAFEEDRWARIRIGETVFRVVKPCARCQIPTIDQDSGEFDGKEPSQTLASFRMAKQVFPDKYEGFGLTPNSALFGENLIPEKPGANLHLGDEVEVIELRRP